MPSLGEFDGLAQESATLQDIDAARLAAESVVQTSRGAMQFDLVSRQRMNDVLMTLEPDNANSAVTWVMADNSKQYLCYEELRDLHYEATTLIGPRIGRVFDIASELKERLRRGKVVTLRDISDEAWK